MALSLDKYLKNGMTLSEINELGFQHQNAATLGEYTNGVIKVCIDESGATNVYVTGIKLISIKKIEELKYLCKRLGGIASDVSAL